MNTNEMLKKTYVKNDGDYLIRNRVFCKDGFSISIQASRGHYCEPRETFEGPYEKVELGYPNKFDPMIANYAEEGDDTRLFTRSVYPYVPIEVVDNLLEKHGGIIHIKLNN